MLFPEKEQPCLFAFRGSSARGLFPRRSNLAFLLSGGVRIAASSQDREAQFGLCVKNVLEIIDRPVRIRYNRANPDWVAPPCPHVLLCWDGRCCLILTDWAARAIICVNRFGSAVGFFHSCKYTSKNIT